MYYNGLVISHKRNVNFLVENDGVVVGNFRYTWSQVHLCTSVYVYFRVHVCVYIYADKIKYLTLPYILPYLTSSLALPYVLPYLTSPYVLPYLTPYITLRLTLHHPKLNTRLF